MTKMLTERELLNKNKLSENINKFTSTQPDDLVYKITDINKNIIAILFLPQKITTVTKNSSVNDFLNKHKKNHKIIIIQSINSRAEQYILNNYSNTEIFRESDLMINLVDHQLGFKYEILTPNERKELFDTYNCTKKHLPRMLLSDPHTKYYNMKVGDICRLIRSGMTSAFYRLITK
uniref:DNA-directed RNA polymerase subunit 5 n=1 Tax=Mimivirus LCMiAC01 TaxID=2506608 RepID=A0A481YZG6_9VIRU|nr:MAG: DNA-directed RNA polymerase subunit 5 [Mimivirus LCMiAC01]